MNRDMLLAHLGSLEEDAELELLVSVADSDEGTEKDALNELSGYIVNHRNMTLVSLLSNIGMIIARGKRTAWISALNRKNSPLNRNQVQFFQNEAVFQAE